MAGEIEKSIRTLGFKPEEIRILLTTQAHFDHVGTLAHFTALSHGSVRIMKGDEGLVADGGVSDYLLGKRSEAHFTPVKVDVVLKDGDVDHARRRLAHGDPHARATRRAAPPTR